MSKKEKKNKKAKKGKQPQAVNAPDAASSSAQLRVLNSHDLAGDMRNAGGMSIGMLEHALLSAFPVETACDWDRMGVLVGDTSQTITGVAVALDATVEAVRACAGCGANVLLTHHPAFIDAPTRIAPLNTGCVGPGSVVWEAVQQNVCLLNVHTALDVSRQAQAMLPGMLGLQFRRIVSPIEASPSLGFGQECVLKPEEQGMTLRELAARCTAVFGRAPRVWGNFDTVMKTVVTATGSAGDMWKDCLALSSSCLICGEIRYHAALDAAAAGLSIIELGHDVSELPFAAVLAQAAQEAGVPIERIRMVNQGGNWTLPEATRR